MAARLYSCRMNAKSSLRGPFAIFRTMNKATASQKEQQTALALAGRTWLYVKPRNQTHWALRIEMIGIFITVYIEYMIYTRMVGDKRKPAEDSVVSCYGRTRFNITDYGLPLHNHLYKSRLNI